LYTVGLSTGTHVLLKKPDGASKYCLGAEIGRRFERNVTLADLACLVGLVALAAAASCFVVLLE
jgi:hypothetical protein